MSSIHWHRYPYLFLTIPLIAGIMASPGLSSIPSRTILCIVLLAALQSWGTWKIRSWIPFGASTCVFLFFTGMYGSRVPVPSFASGETYLLHARCEQILSPRTGIVSSCGLRVHVPLPDTLHVTVGDSLTFRSKLYALTSTSNAHEFDYNQYLRHQGIHARGIPVSPITRTGHSDDMYSYCHSIQRQLIQKLTHVVRDSTTAELLAALCLGSRQDLDPDTKQLFQATGTIHLLSVSGLHMGAIFLLLLYALHACKIRNRKYELMLIPLIWFITGITGLSPSACRAATILSFITIGRTFRQDYIPLNAIAAAAFFSLLVQPNLLYSVSFQMSYAAYLGIVLIYPHVTLDKKKSHAPVRWAYSLLCVSGAAQLATLPITAYYFHTINVNSMIANLFAVPIATYLLYSGILLLILPAIIGSYLAFLAILLTRGLLFSLQSFTRVAINIPDFYPTSLHVLLVYLVITLTILYLVQRKRQTLVALCCTTCFTVLFLYGHSLYRHSRQEVVITNRYRHSVVLLNYKGFYAFLKNTDTIAPLPAYVIANHLQAIPEHEGLMDKRIQYISNQLRTSKRIITILDSLHPGMYPSGILVVTGNTFPSNLPPETDIRLEQIILDHSNSYRCVQAWEQFSTRHGIPLWQTRVKGSITLSLK